MDVFRRFLKESPAVQLYGKLPLAKDYLRVGASKGTGRELREWLDHAFSSNAARDNLPRFPWPARLVVSTGEGEPVMGSGWASSDRGGERSFPFLLFVERRRKVLATAFAQEMRGLVEVWRQLEECYAGRDGYSDGEAFLAGMRNRELELSVERSGESERVGYDAWLTALWPEEGPEGLVKTLASIGRLGAEGHTGPIRVPLVADLPPLSQVAGWWNALSGLELWANGELPSLFFPQRSTHGDEPSFATFLRGRLRVDEARWMASARGQANLGRGDYTRGTPSFAGDVPVGENVASLAISMRGALASARARG